jgi:hypothetical protein
MGMGYAGRNSTKRSWVVGQRFGESHERRHDKTSATVVCLKPEQ